MGQQVKVRSSNSPPPDLSVRPGDGKKNTERDLFPRVRDRMDSQTVRRAIPLLQHPSNQSLITERAKKPSQTFDKGRIEIYQARSRYDEYSEFGPWHFVMRVQRYVAISRNDALHMPNVITRQKVGEDSKVYALKWFELGTIQDIGKPLEDRGSFLFQILPERIDLPVEVSPFIRFVGYVRAYDVHHPEKQIFVPPTAKRPAIAAMFDRTYPASKSQSPPVILVTRNTITYLCIDGFVSPA